MTEIELASDVRRWTRSVLKLGIAHIDANSIVNKWIKIRKFQLQIVNIKFIKIIIILVGTAWLEFRSGL